MTGIETFAVIVATVWLAVLSLVVVLLVRQIGILTVKLDSVTRPFDLNSDGPQVGSTLPDEVIETLPQLASDAPHYVLLMSSTCSPCRDVAAGLRETTFDAPLIGLIAGRGKAADAFVELLPPPVTIVRDPEATDVAGKLGINSTPFVVEVQGGQVTGKSYVRSAPDLLNLMEAREVSDAAEIVGAHRKASGK